MSSEFEIFDAEFMEMERVPPGTNVLIRGARHGHGLISNAQYQVNLLPGERQIEI